MNSGRVPAGLLGLIGLVGLAEATTMRRAAEGASLPAMNWARAGADAAGAPGRSAVLCLGDSQFKLGVAAGLLSERLGRPAWNLALLSGQAPSSYFLLRRALDAGARPEAIVLDSAANLLAQDPRQNLRLWPELLGPGEAADLAWMARDPDLLAAVLVARALPSARARHEIRAGMVGALRGDPPPLPPRLRETVRRNWARNRGGMIAAAAAPDGDAASWFWRTYGPPWKCHPVNAAYLHRLLDLAGRRGVPVFWVVPPTTPEFEAITEHHAIGPAVTAFVRRVRARHPGVVVVDGRGRGYGADQFNDALHLNVRGASRFTEALAAVVGPRLSGATGPGWVSLPGPLRGDAGRALEVLSDSAVVVAQGRRGARR